MFHTRFPTMLTFLPVSFVYHRECPEECKEAIPSLMFAAARFSDLPELRELRSLFSERYGNSLDPYANEEVHINAFTLTRVQMFSL